MRELLQAVADGDLTPAEAEAQLQGYVRDEAGRFDATRERRSGVPEAVLADGKTPADVASLSTTAVETAGRAIVTRLSAEQRAAVHDALAQAAPEAAVTDYDRSGALVAHGPTFEPPELDATVGVVTAGTSDAVPAGEAEVVRTEMGASVERVDDVGVAALSRTLDQLETLRAKDVLIVAAGREGALPTVIAGLVDVPVIGLPVSTGYGHAGEGEAALSGMIQSCTALSVVNVDAGFTAGAQAGLIARRLDDARDDTA